MQLENLSIDDMREQAKKLSKQLKKGDEVKK